MVSQSIGTAPNPHNTVFYDSLGVFKRIFGDFDIFRLFRTRARLYRCARPRLRIEMGKNHHKSSKKRKNAFFLNGSNATNSGPIGLILTVGVGGTSSMIFGILGFWDPLIVFSHFFFGFFVFC